VDESQSARVQQVVDRLRVLRLTAKDELAVLLLAAAKEGRAATAITEAITFPVAKVRVARVADLTAAAVAGAQILTKALAGSGLDKFETGHRALVAATASTLVAASLADLATALLRANPIGTEPGEDRGCPGSDERPDRGATGAAVRQCPGDAVEDVAVHGTILPGGDLDVRHLATLLNRSTGLIHWNIAAASRILPFNWTLSILPRFMRSNDSVHSPGLQDST
jgi:hypothetical protein